jgi:hypothetical protein
MARKSQAKDVNGTVTEPACVLAIERDRKAALEVLLRAHADARETRRAVQDFAVELADLRAAGVPGSDLRWLVSRGYVEHLLDITPMRSSKRALRPFPSLAFRANSCFLLTEQGVALALGHTAHLSTSTAVDAAQPASTPRPRWDPATRELWVGDVLVRRFLTKAHNQVQILNAFQEEGWPEHVDDPLPPNGTPERRRKLHDAVTKLNKHQITRRIEFRGDGTGSGVCWRMVKPTPV